MEGTKVQDGRTLHRVALFQNRTEVWLFWADAEGEPIENIDWPEDWPEWVTPEFAREHGFRVEHE